MPHVAPVVLLLLTGLSGCVQYACTLEARYALEVEVVDASGAPLPVDEVTYAVDGVERACEHFERSTFYCAPEVDGDFVVRVVQDDEVVAEEALTIGQTPDRCHVDTQQLQIVL